MKYIEGQKFGRLTLIKRLGIVNKHCIGIFACSCGKETTTRIDRVSCGKTTSCGCYFKESAAKRIRLQRTTHSMSSTRIYKIYKGIMYRCYGKNGPDYKDYGGRGIECGWKTFEEFFSDMGKSYEEHSRMYGEANTSINRIDNDGNYTKENCEWSTDKGQSRNRRTSRFLTWNGITMTVAGWEDYSKISRKNIEKRLKLGWDIEKALTTKVRNINQ